MSELTCVRCGQEPRLRLEGGDAFIGTACAEDPKTRWELSEAGFSPLRLHADVREVRQALVANFGWAGGWSQRRGHAALTASSSEQPPA